MSEDRLGEKNAFYGKTHNEKTKQKIGEKIEKNERTIVVE
jgi:hypothetical protein